MFWNTSLLKGSAACAESDLNQIYVFKSDMRIYIRGCPGQGTSWFATVVTCLFANVSMVSQKGKHSGCTQTSWKDRHTLSSLLLAPGCTADDCMHAVIARHPVALKHGRVGASHVWEAYYGAWARSRALNVRYFKYEDVVMHGCTSKFSDSSIVRKYFRRRHHCVPVWDQHAWTFWNYSQTNCDAFSKTRNARQNRIHYKYTRK